MVAVNAVFASRNPGKARELAALTQAVLHLGGGVVVGDKGGEAPPRVGKELVFDE